MIDRMNGEVPTDLRLLVNIGRASESGLDVIEVWESQEALDRAFQEGVIPVIDGVNPGVSAALTQATAPTTYFGSSPEGLPPLLASPASRAWLARPAVQRLAERQLSGTVADSRASAQQ